MMVMWILFYKDWPVSKEPDCQTVTERQKRGEDGGTSARESADLISISLPIKLIVNMTQLYPDPSSNGDRVHNLTRVLQRRTGEPSPV